MSAAALGGGVIPCRWMSPLALVAGIACQEAEPDLTVDVVAGDEVVCADPGLRASAPFDVLRDDRFRASVSWNWGGGSIVADLDGDGFVEIVAAVEPGLLVYGGGAEGALAPRPIDPQGPLALDFATGGAAADYDGDGDLDLYVTRSASHPVSDGRTDGRNHLLRNRGDGTFEDVTELAGVDGCTPHPRTGERACWSSLAASWGDADGDGDLDLYVGNYGYVDETDGLTQDRMVAGDPDLLYLNRGDGTFSDASDRLSETFREGWTYAGGFLDLDDDGDLDLYSVNDFGALYPNRVAWNDGRGRFVTDPTDATGLVVSMTGMGLGVGDVNGDGRPDLAIPQWKRNSLLESSGAAWVDYASVRGFEGDPGRGQDVGWGAAFGDLDDDGAEDLVVAYGFLESDNSVWRNAARQRDALYVRRDGVGGYTLADEGRDWGFEDPGAGRGVTLVDWNHDGWLDVWLRNLDAADTLRTARCGDAHWVELSLSWPGSANRFAVGSKIEVEAGGRTHARWVTAGGTSFASAGPPEVHVGLGGAATIDTVRVRWPDGRWTEVDGVERDRRVQLVRVSP